MRFRQHLFIITALLLLFFGMATLWLNRPFIGHHDWVNVLHINRARNYLEFGYFAHNGLQMLNMPHQANEPPIIYRRTPPMLSITLSFALALFSTSEASTRIYGIFITLISISIFYRLALRLLSRRGALLGTFFFATAPQVIYFSTINTPEIPVTPFALTLMWAYISWIKNPRRLYVWIMAACAFIGMWFFYIMPWLLVGLFLHSLLTGTRRQQRMTLGVGLVGAVALGLWLFLTTDGFNQQVIREILDYLHYRSGSAAYDNTQTAQTHYNVLQFIERYVFRLIYGMSPFCLFFSAYGAYLARNPFMVVMFGATVFHTLLWRNATYIHDLFLYPLIWTLALWAGYGLDAVWKKRRQLIPTSRFQRISDGFLIGHLILVIGITILLARFGNTPIVWLAENIKTYTPAGGKVATNLDFVGPHTEYYAGHEMQYSLPHTPQAVEQLLLRGGYALYMLCDDDETAANLPDTLRAYPVKEVCYAIVPES